LIRARGAAIFRAAFLEGRPSSLAQSPSDPKRNRAKEALAIRHFRAASPLLLSEYLHLLCAPWPLF
jgi:hypothetical protein